jgi:hypothetical protein
MQAESESDYKAGYGKDMGWLHIYIVPVCGQSVVRTMGSIRRRLGRRKLMTGSIRHRGRTGREPAVFMPICHPPRVTSFSPRPDSTETPSGRPPPALDSASGSMSSGHKSPQWPLSLLYALKEKAARLSPASVSRRAPACGLPCVIRALIDEFYRINGRIHNGITGTKLIRFTRLA